MRRSLLAPLLISGVAATIFVATQIDTDDSADSLQPPPATAATTPDIVWTESLERWVIHDAGDWTEHGDAVAVVSIASETTVDDLAGQAPTAEAGDDESFQLLGRKVTADVEQVLWTSPVAPVKLPATIEFRVNGWLQDGSSRRVMMDHGESRIAPGKTYVVALRYEDADCSGDGNPILDSRWALVSTKASIPVTNGVVGAGEFETRDVTPDEYRKATGASLKASAAGKPVKDLGTTLAAAAKAATGEPRNVVRTC